MHPTSDGKFVAFRLRPHKKLKDAILEFARHQNIKAGAVISCVGSLEHLSIRFADQHDPFNRSGKFEILSLSGTFSQTHAHLHISVADHEGRTWGGHLMDNNPVYTTAEIVVLALPGLEFSRELDEMYGYHELAVRPSSE